MRAQTIDEVVDSLTEIIHWSKDNRSRLGYFPALYRKVTYSVKDGIAAGSFDDAERMEWLDVVFANRYLEAYEQYRESGRPTMPWKAAFDATGSWRPVVLQHLLLGMNAHIELDLAIAAAEISGGDDIVRLRRDFYKINDILYSLIDQVQLELAEVWPLFRLFDLAAGGFDEALARFGLQQARDRAWKNACRLASLPPDARAETVEQLNRQAMDNAAVILRPGLLLRLTLILVRAGERQPVPRVIEILE